MNGTLTDTAQNTAANAALTADISVNGTKDETDVTDCGGTAGDDWTEWTPIGNSDSPFTGIFDGQGYTISGLYFNTAQNYVGLFGYISSAEIKNVTVANSYFYGRCVGSISGYSLESEITNCTGKGTINGTYYVTTTAEDGTVTVANTNCFAGGISGYNYTSTITECVNNADVSGDGLFVGGISGYCVSSSAIKESINNGDIIGVDDYIGGICGYSQNYSEITDCTNNGNISCTESEANYISGICGRSYRGNIEKCTNNGTVTSAGNYISGICGYSLGYSNSSVSTITNCINAGEVKTSDEATTIGGICGCADVYTAIENCYNTNSINGYNFVGGICGAMTGYKSKTYPNTSSITNCYNNGNINSNGKEVSGICADNYYGIISSCYNTGALTNTGSEDYTGGICAWTGGGSIANCYNSGNITTADGSSYVGGICAYNGFTTVTEISSCYYLDSVANAGIGGSPSSDPTEAKTEDEFASGEVTWLLSGNLDSGNTWLQTIGTDSYPLLTAFDSDSLVVVGLARENSEGEEIYANVLDNGITVKYNGSDLLGIVIDTNTYGGSGADYLEGAYIAIDDIIYQINNYYYIDENGSASDSGDYAFFPVAGESEKSGATVRGGITTKDNAESKTVYYYVTSETEGLTISTDSAADSK